eukprot:TRINITY_DN1083_c0_g1_i2.p1 TRINITY_DN1083_c0_g1~~TRINITY_DN1083_c0_g1_i2.p1  ORF type:complete len:226 (-),score=1.40 TRINITY_DN1083_c0_g1_i2:65-742(-)
MLAGAAFQTMTLLLSWTQQSSVFVFFYILCRLERVSACAWQVYTVGDDSPMSAPEPSRGHMRHDEHVCWSSLTVLKQQMSWEGHLRLFAGSDSYDVTYLSSMSLLPTAEQRRQALQEAAYLLVRHLFGLRYRRIEWQMEPGHVDSAPAGQLGFTLEGVLRKHRIVQDRSRDTAVFSITNSDWRDGGQERAETVLYGAPKLHSKAALLSQSSSQQQAKSVEKKKAK